LYLLFSKIQQELCPRKPCVLLFAWQQEVLATAQTLSLDFPEESKK